MQFDARSQICKGCFRGWGTLFWGPYKLSHANAAEVIARKILPAVCYPCSVLRPTKAQTDSLNTKFFAANAFRQCQTQLAHALFCEHTHAFDIQSAFVYHNLRFWCRVVQTRPDLHVDMIYLYDNSLPLNKRLHGPITLLQKDFKWLQCQFDPRSTCFGPTDNPRGFSLFEKDKKKFDHDLRELIRAKLAKILEEKHDKWQGSSNCDFAATTQLVRKLEPSSPLRVPLIRLLSDAHATPFRLSKMGIRNTAHCPWCLAEHGDIKHVIWQCPRFAGLREHWPEPVLQRHNWHECTLNAMVCTRDLPENIRKTWHSFQILVSRSSHNG